ncbi:ribonuclease HII [Pontibacillus salicampi]|uniref:Ribonuclease HII n=1 Tax=Pontibacillus salicampi TaxID=1449801 RepID=A0ABV6LNY4_9BACI
MSYTYTIAQIKQHIEAGLTTEEELAFRRDARKGVQQLMRKYDRERAKQEELRQQFNDMSKWERECRARGKRYIAGIDEAGRGPLAGPVVAAAVMLPEDFYLPGLTDSKQLTLAEREHFFTYIQEHAVSYGIAMVDSKTIDEINILQATKQAMLQAIQQLNPTPDQLLIDAVPLPEASLTYQSMPKGDQRSISIAAASVLAKVSRDRYMSQLGQQYPGYHLEKNMGYGTKAHLDALRNQGVTPYHRLSFAPVKAAVKL